MRGLRAKDQSFATGLLLALLVWTVTRLIDGVTGSATIEYESAYAPIVLSDGRPGTKMTVTLRNLSRDAAIRNLAVVISDPAGRIEFIPKERVCAYPSPTWAEGATCEGFTNGLNFVAPWLVAGSQVQMGIKFVGVASNDQRPVVRIRPSDTETKIRLVKPSFQTWLAVRETEILITLAVLTLILLAISIAAGITKDSSPNGKAAP